MAVYDKPLLYDIAFSYRDIGAEVDALASFFARASGRAAPLTVLELASGPADHAIEWSLRGARASAIDLSQPMCDYARSKAALAGTSIEVHCANMIDFELGQRFDLALLMINSISHLHSVPQLVEHLRTIARHLEPSGVYVLEVQHPRDFVGRKDRPSGVSKPWRVDAFGLEVETTWGSPEDPYDPLRQLFEATVTLRVRTREAGGGHAKGTLAGRADGEQTQEGRSSREARAEESGPASAGPVSSIAEEVFVEQCTMRDWGLGELEAAVELSGTFEIAGLHGDLQADVPLDAESWRMVVVLRRR